VFSRTERAYLKILSEGRECTASARLEVAFPNPVYRRKLMWGIRQKTSSSLVDWQLYSRAANRDPRILPRDVSDADGLRPLVADPLVTFFDELRGIWARRRSSNGRFHDKPSVGTR
jgi:hypothetical protein